MAIVKKISELTPKGSNLANTDLLIVGVDNGTDYDLKSVTGAQLLGNATNGLVPYTGATTNVNLGEFEVKAGQLSLDTTPTGTATVGTTRWNDALGISETTLKGGEVVLKNGVDLVARVVNKVTPNTTLTKANYQVVRISGAQGQRLAVNLAQANNDNNSADTLGVVCETIATNAEGFIMTMGQLENINTTGSLQSETWVDGDVLYLSPTTAGKITNIKPTGATGHIVILGYVEYAHAVNGKIYVKIMNGWELDELHNVSISGPLDKQILSYENSTSLWKNKSVTTADIADSTNKRYVTDANLTVIGNTSGTNTGDQDLSNLATKSNPTFTGLTTLDTLKVTTGNYITPVDVVGIDVTGNVNRISASNGRTALGLGTLATQNGTFSGTSSGTNTGDQIISDATISLTDITTNNFSTTKHGFVPKGTNVGNFLKDDGTWGTPASGSTGGIWGIANSSGVYTYYATWALAVAAAVSGQVIELFADITESAVSYTLKNGVNVNGNGHTISFSLVDGFVATSAPTICEINNIVVNQATASVSGLYINATGSIIGGNATFNSNNASSNGVYGRLATKIYGFNCNGYNPIFTSSTLSPNAVIDNVYVDSLGGGITTGTLSNSVVKSNTASGVPVGLCYTINNCYIYSNGGSAIGATIAIEVNNCTIISVTSRVLTGSPGIFTLNNCYIKSSAGDIGNGTFNNCTILSSINPINAYMGNGIFNNCTITASASAVFSLLGSGSVNNCNVICNYNNAGGYGFYYSTCSVNNSFIQLANSSSTAFYSAGAVTMYLANNSIKGTTNFKNVNVTNGQTNTADAQGNVILQ